MMLQYDINEFRERDYNLSSLFLEWFNFKNVRDRFAQYSGLNYNIIGQNLL